MKVAKISQEDAFHLLAKKLPPGMKLTSPSAQKWDVVVAVRDCGQLTGRFVKSIAKHVDDQTKRGAVLRALSELYAAVCNDDYQSALEASGVGCKVAHSFAFQGATHKVWELKPNNKDRIYFFPFKDGLPKGRKVIFLLIAYHKKDQKTPKEVSDVCEDDIKAIIEADGNIQVCEEKNVAKK